MDFAEVAKQLAVFGAKVGTWSFGAAVVAEKVLVNALGEGWAFPDLEKVALAAAIAGPVALVLRVTGLAEKPNDPA